MTDVLDQLGEQEEAFLQRMLAPHLDTQLSDDEIEALAETGRQCSECGLPIPTARLRANPYAYRCVSCQQDWEEGR